MYISGYVIPVLAENKAAYVEMAQHMGPIFMDYGAVEIIEGWEDDVPDGEHTDLRKAVAAKEGEKIVFSWALWPDKETYDKAHKDMMQDERMQNHPELMFDGKRMIFGTFTQLFSLGR